MQIRTCHSKFAGHHPPRQEARRFQGAAQGAHAILARLELGDFVDKLAIVVENGLLILPDLFDFAFEVPDGLGLLLDDFGRGDKQVFVGRGAPSGSRVGLAAFIRDGVGVVG